MVYMCDDQSVNLSQNRSSTIFRKNLVSFSLFFCSAPLIDQRIFFVTDRLKCLLPASGYFRYRLNFFVTDRRRSLLPTDEDVFVKRQTEVYCYRSTIFFCYRPEVFATDRRTFFVTLLPTDGDFCHRPTEIFATDQRRFFVLLKYGKTCFATY
ncbi:unnamed protein product [Laminaria digitata]